MTIFNSSLRDQTRAIKKHQSQTSSFSYSSQFIALSRFPLQMCLTTLLGCLSGSRRGDLSSSNISKHQLGDMVFFVAFADGERCVGIGKHWSGGRSLRAGFWLARASSANLEPFSDRWTCKYKENELQFYEPRPVLFPIRLLFSDLLDN